MKPCCTGPQRGDGWGGRLEGPSYQGLFLGGGSSGEVVQNAAACHGSCCCRTLFCFLCGLLDRWHVFVVFIGFHYGFLRSVWDG